MFSLCSSEGCGSRIMPMMGTTCTDCNQVYCGSCQGRFRRCTRCNKASCGRCAAFFNPTGRECVTCQRTPLIDINQIRREAQDRSVGWEVVERPAGPPENVASEYDMVTTEVSCCLPTCRAQGQQACLICRHQYCQNHLSLFSSREGRPMLVCDHCAPTAHRQGGSLVSRSNRR